jgi:hypothetical protein
LVAPRAGPAHNKKLSFPLSQILANKKKPIFF